MAQILFQLVGNIYDSKTPAEISASNELREKKYLAIGLGSMETAVFPDGFYACPENPKGRPWRGDMFGLLIFDKKDKDDKDLVKTKDKISKAIPLISGFAVIEMEKYKVDISKLPTPEKYINGGNIYRLKEVKDLPLIDRTDEIITFSVVK